jgi:hypothetical protein
VEVHELVGVLFPDFVKAYATLMTDERVCRFSGLLAWRRRLCEILKETDSRNLYVMNFVTPISLSSLFITLCLYKSGATVIEYRQPGLPVAKNQLGLLKRTLNRIIRAYESRFDAIKKLIIQICVRFLAHYMLMIFRGRQHFLFLAGNIRTSRLEKKKEIKCPIKIIPANSWDYSRILRLSSTEYQPLVQSRYAVLLDGAGPKFPGDELLTGDKLKFTEELWYPALCKFFDRLEEKLDIRIVIAAHPKTSHEPYPSYFGGRQVFHGDTYKLVKDADFVLTRLSTAISYALYFNRPILFITSDELELIPHFKSASSAITQELATTPINVDYFDDKVIMDSLSFDSDLYKKFIFNYLTSSDSGKPNYQILLNDVMGIETNSHFTKQC